MDDTRKKIAHPHDKFFQAALGHRDAAAELFRYSLPAEVTAKIDWSAINLWRTVFTSSQLRRSAADVVYQAPYSHNNLN